MTCMDSARTTQLMQRTLNIPNARFTGHRDRENGFESGDRHGEEFVVIRLWASIVL
jgi:hypothetical protein